MDIEGAELEALSGAERIIKNYAPIIAVSIYHKRNDIWDIPKLLLRINPSYRFAFGHYSACLMDTVLYALPMWR